MKACLVILICVEILLALARSVAGGPATATTAHSNENTTTTVSPTTAQHTNATTEYNTSTSNGSIWSTNATIGPTTEQPGPTDPPELPGGCDFEEDFCGWTNMNDDDFEWIRNSGRTGSANTGPEHDMSLNKTGYYALIEASWPRVPGHEARLLSPSMTGIRCMRFYYNMYGDGMGELKVYLKEDDKHVVSVWGRYRNQGQGWHSSNVTVYGDQHYHVAFFARRGVRYSSDMGLDNITFVNGTCDGKPLQIHRHQTEADAEAAHEVLKGEPGTCDFDVGFCEWTNVPLDDQFDWLLKSGMTGTFDTGPESDNTGHKNGQYLFIESSSPQALGHKAQIVGPRLCGPMCMQFYYHMYGTQIGTLNIYQRIGLGVDDRIWTLSGPQGQHWNEALVNINGNCYQIIIEGIIGNGYLGDVAVDDVVFTKGDCCAKKYRDFDVETAGDCSFNDGFCNWTNHKRDNFDWTIHEGTTPSNHTGPSHSFKGKYAYVEASEPRLFGDKAVLVGPVLRGQVCMHFKYHMYGKHTGSLAVYKHGSGVPRHQMWKRTGNHGNIWRDAYVFFPCEGPLFQIELEAVVNGWRSDIAIDEISFDHHLCPQVTDKKIPIHPPPTRSPWPISSGNCTFPDTFCDWKNDRTDEIDWEIGTGNTASLGSGPKRDVDGNGKYIFIEASRYRYRQKARLYSGYLRGRKCMRFHYHMTGRSVGVLMIYKFDVKEKRRRRLWYRRGGQGKGWRRAFVNVRGDGYRVSFIAVRGARHHGDVALDDISFTPGRCKRLLDVPFQYNRRKPKKPSIPFKDRTENCTFDDGNLCKWKNVGEDNFDWTLRKGSTPSRYTGPPSDHSGNGMYVYIEASPPRFNQDSAYLSLTTGGPARCLQFYYYMFGKSTGQLKVNRLVRIGRVVDRKLELLWARKGEQGKRWLLAEVDVPPAVTYDLIIEGVCGEDFRGDTAVDDITLTDGFCKSPTMTTVPSLPTLGSSADDTRNDSTINGVKQAIPPNTRQDFINGITPTKVANTSTSTKTSEGDSTLTRSDNNSTQTNPATSQPSTVKDELTQVGARRQV